jgi:hypothetical protein
MSSFKRAHPAHSIDRIDSSLVGRAQIAYPYWTMRLGMGLLAIQLLVLTGCGAATPATTTTSTATITIPTVIAAVTSAPTAQPTTRPTTMPANTNVPGAEVGSSTPSIGPASAKAYDHAADYSWVAGQLRQEGSCWIVTYVSPLVEIAADKYNNQFALLPGKGWDAAKVKDGEWVIVQGQPEPGTAPASSCTAHGYTVTGLRPNPNAPGGSGVSTPVSTSTQGSATPGGASNGGSTVAGVDIQVTDFTVSKNFEIRGQFNATNTGKTTVKELAPTHVTLKRPNGEVLLDVSAQGGVMDMKPMAGLPPGTTRPYGFSASGGKAFRQIAEGDEVTGVLTVRVDGQEGQIPLPTTRVTTIRIP